MYLGETIEEKRESYELLTRKAKRFGKFFAVLFGIVVLILAIMLVNTAEGNRIFIVSFSILIVFLEPIVYYWYGYFLYFAFITVKSWFAKLGIGVTGVAVAAGHSVAVSYLLGGRKSAKTSIIVWLIAMAITLSIGFYVGLFKYFAVRKEAKQLGFI